MSGHQASSPPSSELAQEHNIWASSQVLHEPVIPSLTRSKGAGSARVSG